jgi:hypothetical protein
VWRRFANSCCERKKRWKKVNSSVRLRPLPSASHSTESIPYPHKFVLAHSSRQIKAAFSGTSPPLLPPCRSGRNHQTGTRGVATNGEETETATAFLEGSGRAPRVGGPNRLSSTSEPQVRFCTRCRPSLHELAWDLPWENKVYHERQRFSMRDGRVLMPPWDACPAFFLSAARMSSVISIIHAKVRRIGGLTESVALRAF